jgi:hypothetical protein
MNFMVISNIAFFVPVISAVSVHEFTYALIGFSACVISPTYHYMTENNSKYKTFRNITRNLDWLSGIACFSYMYYFLFIKVNVQYLTLLFIALSLTLLFFWYGFKWGGLIIRRRIPGSTLFLVQYLRSLCFQNNL